jgi:hypothetical protein
MQDMMTVDYKRKNTSTDSSLLQEHTQNMHCQHEEVKPREGELDWSHLQIVYEFLLRFVASSETGANMEKRYIDHSFVVRLLDLLTPKNK